MNSFKEDLELGVRAQDFIIKQLSPQLRGLNAVEGYFKEYDLISDDGYTIEVKYDRLSKDTNNIGIEYECNHKPSGIASTKAIEWVHIFHYNKQVVYSRIKAQDLRAYIDSNRSYLPTARGGDGGRAELYLINKDDFVTRFTPIISAKSL
jgi:hypothetical protein